MATFWIGAALMIAVALACVLPPLLRRQRPADPDPQAAELAVYRQRLGELKDDRGRDALTETQFEAAQRELEAALATDLMPLAHDRGRVRDGERHWVLALGIAIALPLAAVALYERLGARAAATQALITEQETRAKLAQMQAAVQRLEARLATEADNGALWRLLGRARLAMGESAQAAEAFGRAQILLGDEPDLLLDYAQALAQTEGDRLEGGPAKLIERAVGLSPEHPRALWMAALSALQQGARAEAKQYLERLQPLAKPGTEAEQLIKAQLAELQDIGKANPSAAAEPGTEVQAPRIEVHVSLDAALKARVSPEDTVFVFARAEAGPRMPLAVVRGQVKDLPLTVVLDDTQSMAPTLKLSNFPQIVVGARVSRSGNPMPQSGDLEGFAEHSVATAPPSKQPVAVSISRSVP